MTDRKIAHLSEAKPTADAMVVDELEAALALARRGEIRSVVIVADKRGNETYTGYALSDYPDAIAALELVKHKLLVRWAEGSEAAPEPPEEGDGA